MHFAPELSEAVLIRRYKRFLADVRCPDGRELTIHCPNSGSMRSCCEPGSPVCYSTSTNARRTYPHTLEMIKVKDTWVGVNTSLTNSLVCEALLTGLIAELTGFESLRREVKTPEGHRLDIMLSRGSERIYVEVKNCTLVEDGCALFPDAVTARGTRHLEELARLVHRACGQCDACLLRLKGFAAAGAVDPAPYRDLGR